MQLAVDSIYFSKKNINRLQNPIFHFCANGCGYTAAKDGRFLEMSYSLVQKYHSHDFWVKYSKSLAVLRLLWQQDVNTDFYRIRRYKTKVISKLFFVGLVKEI